MAEAKKVADLIIAVADGLAISTVGPEAAINPVERSLFDASLPPMLASMERETFDRVSQASYPLVALAGVGLWGWRLYVLSVNKWSGPGSDNPPVEPPPVEPPSATVGQNGGNDLTVRGGDSRADFAQNVRPI